jgi:hypothetical protein
MQSLQPTERENGKRSVEWVLAVGVPYVLVAPLCILQLFFIQPYELWKAFNSDTAARAGSYGFALVCSALAIIILSALVALHTVLIKGVEHFSTRPWSRRRIFLLLIPCLLSGLGMILLVITPIQSVFSAPFVLFYLFMPGMSVLIGFKYFVLLVCQEVSSIFSRSKLR